MIINATYTANLAAYLTVSRMQTPIETILDLSRQTRIEYGTLKDSQLQTFFQKTDVPRSVNIKKESGSLKNADRSVLPWLSARLNKLISREWLALTTNPSILWPVLIKTI